MSASVLRLKRVYEPAAAEDGRRILVDGLWPRGVSKEKAKIDFWARTTAVSADLRRWYGHRPERWQEFRARYFRELDENGEGMAQLRRHLEPGVVTLVFASKEERLNNAVALRDYLCGAKE